MAWQDWLGDLSGYKPRYDALAVKFSGLAGEMSEAEKLADRLLWMFGGAVDPAGLSGLANKLTFIIDNADSFRNYPIPAPPVIDFEIIKSGKWVTSQMAYVIARGMRFYQLDVQYRLTNQANWLNAIMWEWSDSKEYIREWWDCDDFAISFWLHCRLYLKLNSCAFTIDYSSEHGYIMLLYADAKKSILEPQTDTVAPLSERNMDLYRLADGMFSM
jgi:hypothetical protein